MNEPTLKGKIANLCGVDDATPDYWIADQTLSLLSAELEKLTVLGDEQLGQAVWGEWNAEHLRVAGAQLSHTKEQLRELLE